MLVGKPVFCRQMIWTKASRLLFLSRGILREYRQDSEMIWGYATINLTWCVCKDRLAGSACCCNGSVTTIEADSIIPVGVNLLLCHRMKVECPHSQLRVVCMAVCTEIPCILRNTFREVWSAELNRIKSIALMDGMLSWCHAM